VNRATAFAVMMIVPAAMFAKFFYKKSNFLLLGFYLFLHMNTA
jgi:hypothetical protein